MKLGRPSHTTIWHRPWNFFEICRKFFEIWSILWRHYTPLLVENWPNFAGLWKTQFLMKTQIKNTKRRKMRSSTRWLSRFFKILGFWPLKFQKIDFFWKMIPKIQNIQNFQKTGTYVIHLLVSTSVQNFKSIAQFLTPKWSVFVSESIPNYDVIFFKCDFCNFWGSYAKTNDTIRFLSRNWSRLIPFLSTFINLKIWPFLTWPWPDLR